MQPMGLPGGHGRAEYEFNAAENETIDDLASKMRFVGLMSALLGLALLASVTAGLVLGRMTGAVVAVNGVQGILMLLVGIWTRSAAAGFQRIVDTQGNDISNLMRALQELRRIYTLQRVLYVVAIVIVVLVLQLALLFMAGH